MKGLTEKNGHAPVCVQDSRKALEDKNIDISPIVEKMQEVKDVDPFFPNPPTTIPKSFNPKSFNRIKVPLFNADEDELGKPPKIVM